MENRSWCTPEHSSEQDGTACAFPPALPACQCVLMVLEVGSVKCFISLVPGIEVEDAAFLTGGLFKESIFYAAEENIPPDFRGNVLLSLG